MKTPNIHLIAALVLVASLACAEQRKTYTLEAKFMQMPTNGVTEILSDSANAAKDSFSFGANVEVRLGGKTAIRTRGDKLDIDETLRGLDVLAAPRVYTWAAQEAIIQIGAEAPSYFVPAKDGTYRLEKMEEGPGVSLKSVINAVPGKPDQVALDLQCRLIEIEGRQGLPGVDLPVGPPIMRTREIKTKVVANLNDWICLGGGLTQGDKTPSPCDLLIFVRVEEGQPQP